MKQIKDPIYGYIDIDDEFIRIINTPEFQRLRSIVQTSYQALYPSALHNRFVHSIGVYHLGKKAISCFGYNIRELKLLEKTEWDILAHTFLVACLLHDVGHSPYSHTGEEFYTNGTASLRDEIKKLLPDATQLATDLQESGGIGKPHEAMSAIVGLHLMRKLDKNSNIDEEFFVRCIIGNTYKSDTELVRNTIIGMLNGSLIDVDKLDYLIRDGYVTGFNTMALDVDRLFAGYTIVDYTDTSASCKQVAAYKRGALSVIENVAFANDLERHWIQNHPAILFDAKLIQLAIVAYNDYMKSMYGDKIGEKNVFTQKALSYEGYKAEGIPLALLSDDDIIYYLKNCVDLSSKDYKLHEQYFDREKRLKPLWKSETEFRHLEQELVGKGIRRSFVATLKAIKENIFFINQEEMDKANEEMEQLKSIRNSSNEELKRIALCSEKNQDKILKIFHIFNQFRKDEELDFEFAIIFVDSHYESNYRKLEKAEIYIEFALERVIPLKNALSIMAVPSSEDEKNGYYYIFTSKNNIERMKAKNKNIAQCIMEYIAKHW